MSAALVFLACFAAILLAFAGLVWMRSGSENRRRAGFTSNLDDFAIDKYLPMERLLRRDDEEFLKRERGFRPEMLKTLRRNRARVLRSYMSEIRTDFDGLYYIARASVLHIDADVSSLVHMLVRQRLLFYWACGTVECRVQLYRLGIGHVDVRPLLTLIETMQRAASSLEPLAAAA